MVLPQCPRSRRVEALNDLNRHFPRIHERSAINPKRRRTVGRVREQSAPKPRWLLPEPELTLQVLKQGCLACAWRSLDQPSRALPIDHLATKQRRLSGLVPLHARRRTPQRFRFRRAVRQRFRACGCGLLRVLTLRRSERDRDAARLPRRSLRSARWSARR